MLSTEIPPSDLCCSDERASDNNQHQLGVDLFKDYVFNTRGKDIKNNWHFSQKNLQLCLKHGVKDVLPPFHSLGSVTNKTTDQLLVVDSLSDGVSRRRDFGWSSSGVIGQTEELRSDEVETTLAVSRRRRQRLDGAVQRQERR
ncbi:hypothetical protein SASPL_127067 [Salvia splendens]|uniref:Uncharacterized protein n=1 Tax=Salvia splendens TaxID=180675 RepID=A0A8X8ZQL1_SALSN|nr:hypothetical protein SASPL_127067 [Salvia splendens]